MEEQFCRCGPEAFFRRMKGIRGRKYHNKPSPFYRGSAGGKRIVFQTEHPSLDCLIYGELEEGKEKAYAASQIIFCDIQEKYHSVLITERIKSTEDLVRELEARGIVGGKPVAYIGDPNEKECIKRLLPGFDIKIWNDLFRDGEKRQFVAKFEITDLYFRCIAKIAFHYFLKHFPQFTGFEHEFKGIKHFIMNGGDVNQWVRQERKEFIEQLKGGATPQQYLHVIAVEKTYLEIIARTQFFIGPNLVPYHSKIFIGKNPEKLHYDQSIGHQLVYFDKTDKNGHDGIMVPLNTIKKSLLP